MEEKLLWRFLRASVPSVVRHPPRALLGAVSLLCALLGSIPILIPSIPLCVSLQKIL